MKSNIEGEIREAIVGYLEDIGFLVIMKILEYPDGDGDGPDIVLEVASAGGSTTILIETRDNGQPRIVREAVNELLRYLGRYPGAYGVIAAPFISRRSAEILAAEGIGYIDLAGNCRLEFKEVYISVEGKKNPFPENRDLRSLYSPKASRIVHALLLSPGKAWRVAEMSDEVKVSMGEVHKVYSVLRDREWAAKVPDGLVLREPFEVLEEWSRAYNYRKNRVRAYFAAGDLDETGRRLAGYCTVNGLRFAQAIFTGAARRSHCDAMDGYFAYVESGIEEIAKALDLEPAVSGSNFTLMIPYDEGVFYGLEEVDGLPVTSPVQSYLDLKSYRGLGEEVARSVRDKEIEPLWRHKARISI